MDGDRVRVSDSQDARNAGFDIDVEESADRHAMVHEAAGQSGMVTQYGQRAREVSKEKNNGGGLVKSTPLFCLRREASTQICIRSLSVNPNHVVNRKERLDWRAAGGNSTRTAHAEDACPVEGRPAWKHRRDLACYPQPVLSDQRVLAGESDLFALR
jgi:hypothetical protein